ncbi:helix-turn-helix transcriptional regulator [Streptomyces sp. NBC_01685]|uniref:helix-turn-helix domain-containing protein n=1 Tax=Streptomyces sp. NBC_01685 TaxID=2975910 RepID=UPI002E2EA94E|nr:helix-turn-helix transcriptional regulator [Streptomyces sp. NBC_01685]
MPAKLDYRWHLRELMAKQGMFSTTALQPMLAERGIKLSTSQVYRLVTEKPERLSMKVLMALIDILGCPMDELIEPVATAAARPRKVASGEVAGDPGLGSFRPKRARISGADS